MSSADLKETPDELAWLSPHEMEIHWADGHQSRYLLDFLRLNCPCAECQGHGLQLFQALPELPPGRRQLATIASKLVVRHGNSRPFSPALPAPGGTFRTPQYARYSENLNACQERRLLAEKRVGIPAPPH